MASRELARIAAHYEIEVESGHLFMQRLKARLRKLEKKYNCSSESMWVAISQNPMIETEETCHWMQDYALLKMANGTGMAGTHTKTTNKSMIPA